MPFRCVEGEQAGPDALGILIPPGRRSVAILRPRSLDWDLLPIRAAGEQRFHFAEFGREEAAAVPQRLLRGLEDWAARGTGGIETISSQQGTGYRVRARVGEFTLVACLRQPGKAYSPALFATAEEARTAAAKLSAVLCPAADAEQELYFNTRHFSR